MTYALIVEMTGFFGFSFFWIGMTYVIYKANQRISMSNIAAQSADTRMSGAPDRQRAQPAQPEPLIP